MFMCMCVGVDSVTVLCIFIMWPVTEYLRACGCMWMQVHCSHAPACMHVCEEGAAEFYHRLVGHSSAANQRSKWL